MNELNEKAKAPIVRIGLSPARPDYGIGAYRTLMANTLLAASEEGGVNYIRVDDTNPIKHDDAHIEPLLRNYTSLIGESGVLNNIPENVYGAVETSLGISTLRQSKREDRYREATRNLISSGFAYPEDDIIYFDLDAFIHQFGDTVEQPYVGSKTGRSVNLRAWRGKGGVADSRFPIMTGSRALYHLATVIDDTDLGITHVIRGADKIDSQVPQDILRLAMGLEGVTHAYTKMMTKGENVSIRLQDLLQQGISIVAIRSYILSSLTGKPDTIYRSLEDAESDFDLKKIRPATDAYDAARMQNIHRKIRS